MGARTYDELLSAQTELAHFNPNHDPRNGQFAKAIGSGVAGAAAVTASNQKAKIRNTAIRAKRVPERVAKVRRVATLTGIGASAGASIALGLLTGGFGALPMAAAGVTKAAAAGSALFGAYMGGMLGTSIGVVKEELSDYLKGKGADKEDWDRYIRSNTNYDRIL